MIKVPAINISTNDRFYARYVRTYDAYVYTIKACSDRGNLPIYVCTKLKKEQMKGHKILENVAAYLLGYARTINQLKNLNMPVYVR